MALIAALFVPRVGRAGPWVDDNPGHGYFSLSYSNYSASQYFAGQGQFAGPFQTLPIPYGKKLPIQVPYITSGNMVSGAQPSTYTSQSAQLYGEVSLWKRLGLVIQMPLVNHITQTLNKGLDTLSDTHVGDLVIGFKYQLPLPKSAKGFAIGPQAYLTTPTGDQNGTGAYPTDLQKLNAPLPLPTGNGTVDLESRISAGYSFYPIPIFMIAEVGYHHHFDDAVCNIAAQEGIPAHKQSVAYSDDIPWNFQFGASYAPKKPVKGFHHFTVIGVLHGDKSLENGFIDRTGTSIYTRPCGQANNSTYLSAGGQVMIFPIKWIGVTYAIEHTLTGGNTGYGLTNTAGLATQF